MSSRVICIARDQILSFTHQVTTLGCREGQCLKKHSCEPLLLPSGTDTQEGGCWIGWELHFSVSEGTFFPRMAGPVCVPSFPHPGTCSSSSGFAGVLTYSGVCPCLSQPSATAEGGWGQMEDFIPRLRGQREPRFTGSQAVIVRVWIWSLSLRKRWIRGGSMGRSKSPQ